MFLLIKLVKKLINILQSEISPAQIAGGAAFGTIIGLLPFFSLLSVVLFVIVLLIKVNIASALLAMAVFGLLGFAFDPLAHQIGLGLLVKADGLTPFWTSLFNTPVIPFTRFNNTVVLGNLIIGLLLFAPIYIFTKRGIIGYRARYRDKVAGWKVMKLLKFTSIADMFNKYR